MLKRAVRDVMTSPVVSVGEQTPFKAIVETLERHRVSAVPVVDAAGRLLGIISEADLMVREHYPRSGRGGTFAGAPGLADQVKATATVAGQLMTAKVVSVRPDDSLRTAAALMRENAVKRLPVVDRAGTVVGIVSRADLLRIFLRSDEEIQADICREALDAGLWIDPSEIEVEVRDGEVTLGGLVEKRSNVDQLVGLAHAVDGVVDVHCFIRFREDDRAAPDS